MSIRTLADDLGINPDYCTTYGHDMAKVQLDALEAPRSRPNPARLVLVSAITPTKAGEGKTTTSIGLADGLRRLGESACLALREPSLGPCFGVKGGGTGGGQARLHPSHRINLHFTGDFHAITSAHNLLAAAIDNHLHFGHEPSIDSRRVIWPRVIDMNDRALRDVVLGLGGKANGHPRESAFDITAASELMAILCLATDREDLRQRIDNTLVAFGSDGSPVFAKSLNVTGAMMVLLEDAIVPNLVRTREGTPAFVHGGPFANIAHGCNSVMATKMALHHADWVVTEAGFGFDLGAEKFFDIKCRSAGLDPTVVVLVASVRALKMHGGVSPKELEAPNAEAVARGLENLEKHIESVHHFNKRPIVALNRFGPDTDEEIAVVKQQCEKLGVPFAESTHFKDGGAGAEALAQAVVDLASTPAEPMTLMYELDVPVADKIAAVATKVYGADGVAFSKAAMRDLKVIDRLGFGHFPVCVAKTQSSLSDDPKLGGRPRNFEITVRNVAINSGAGFLVVLTGDIMRMPGLPRRPAAADIDLVDGEIVGL